MKKFFGLALSFSAMFCVWSADLIENGKTGYTIVFPDRPDTGNRFALKELRLFLKKASGAEFKAVPASKAPKEKRIFLGLSDTALKILGKDPRGDMKDQDTRVKTVGNDLFLFGKGEWGDMFAVYDYLENVLGYRWYDARGGMKVPDCRDLKWQELDRKFRYSVEFRAATGYWIFHRPEAHLAFLRNRQNFQWIPMYLKMKGIMIPKEGEMWEPASHTLSAYIPGRLGGGERKPFSWQKNQDYSKTNPEFFGMDPRGKRTGGPHLCFSNPGLRKELTANILEHMKRRPDIRIFSLGAYDSPGKFCYCPDCIAQEKKYRTPAAAYFVYLLELSKAVAEKFPQNRIGFSAYRKAQTQIPPTGFGKMPDNLVVKLAPIDDDFSKSWAHKNNADTRTHLRQWGQICSRLAVWYYPNPYSGQITPPMGNIRRLADDIREMVKDGLDYTKFEHNVGVANMIGFTELQSFLMLQQFKDVSQDTDALIREFMEFEYGKAAPLMMKYWNELEDATLNNKIFMTWDAPLPVYQYLTPENLIRWSGYFEEMEKLLADSPVQLYNMKRVKINLEMAMLNKYNHIIRKYPKFKPKPQELADSVKEVFTRTITDFYSKGFEARAKSAMRSLNAQLDSALVRAGKEGKPLPPEIFGKIPANRIFQAVPSTRSKPRVNDPDAAWGVAALNEKIPVPKLPYSTHFSDYTRKKYYPNISWIRAETIGPRGKYKIYQVAQVTLTPNCEIFFGGDSWFRIHANLGEAYEFGSLNQVVIYASLKFEGPAFYPEDKGKTNRVLCDRIIVVKMPQGK